MLFSFFNTHPEYSLNLVLLGWMGGVAGHQSNLVLVAHNAGDPRIKLALPCLFV